MALRDRSPDRRCHPSAGSPRTLAWSIPLRLQRRLARSGTVECIRGRPFLSGRWGKHQRCIAVRVALIKRAHSIDAVSARRWLIRKIWATYRRICLGVSADTLQVRNDSYPLLLLLLLLCSFPPPYIYCFTCLAGG